MRFSTPASWRNAALAFTGLAALAFAMPARADQGIRPSGTIVLPPATTVNFPDGINPPSAAGMQKAAIPFRPGMPMADYIAAKTWANAHRGSKPGAGMQTPSPQLTILKNFAGLNETQTTELGFGFTPPDVNADASPTQVVETCNNAIGVYSLTGALLKLTSFATLIGDGQLHSDPQVEYDPVWKRWVITCINLGFVNGVHDLHILISKTSSATGAYFSYTINVSLGNGDFWDYPHQGLQQDAVVITGNVFQPNGGPFGAVFGVAKSILYNGGGFSTPVFGLQFNEAPAKVLDQNPCMWLMSSEPGTANIGLYEFCNPGNGFYGSVFGLFQVPVSVNYTVPASAFQPGSSTFLDTLDSRFQNRSTQVGADLYNINCGNFPQLFGYILNTSSLTQVGFENFFQSGSSDDWNPSIAVNAAETRVALTWTSDDTTINPQMIVAGTTPAGFTGGLTSGVAAFTSGTVYTDNPNGVDRWGDYSSVVLDNKTANGFWAANEDILGNSEFNWGTRLVHFTAP